MTLNDWNWLVDFEMNDGHKEILNSCLKVNKSKLIKLEIYF
jgi:hypothetical protein